MTENKPSLEELKLEPIGMMAPEGCAPAPLDGCAPSPDDDAPC